MLAKMGRFNRKFSRNIARNGWSLVSDEVCFELCHKPNQNAEIAVKLYEF